MPRQRAPRAVGPASLPRNRSKVRGAVANPLEENPSHILTREDIAALDKITAQLEQPDLASSARTELLDAERAIIDHYSCDPRICE